MEIKNLDIELSNKVKIPAIGFGTWQVKDGQEAYNSVLYALQAGYRHIDTAYVYGNEASVGQAIKDSKLDRKNLFITTKLPSDIKTYDGTFKYFEESKKALGLDYVDLYLIHAPWPWSNVGQNCDEGNIEAWKAMIELYNRGEIRAIGVSNFSIDNIKNIYEATKFMPMVNQIRYFIGNTQPKLSEYCKDNNILIEAYSPFATGELLDNSKLEEIAKKYNTSIPKICLQFCIQNGTLPLPKSVHKERIYDNLELPFEISKEDMEYLNSLDGIASKRPLRY